MTEGVALNELNEEVLVAEAPLVDLDGATLDDLKRRALANARRRVRICTHASTDDSLHEMFIVHTAGVYVPPHKHLGKSESAHVIEGQARAVFFDDEGAVQEVLELGPAGSGRSFYYRVDEPVFHTLLVESEFFVMHEVTSGPFVRADTVFAPWAPPETDLAAADDFRQRLEAAVAARG